MDPRPQTITNDILRRIKGCLSKPHVPSLMLIRLEADAEKIKSVDPASYYIALGLIYGLRGDLVKVTQLYTAATYYTDASYVHQNFSVALAKACGYHAALQATRDALRAADLSNPEIVKNLGHNAVLYGLVEEALKMRTIMQKLRPGTADEQFMAAMVELEALGFSHIHEKLMLVYSVLERHKVVVYSVNLMIQDIGDTPYAEYVFQVGETDLDRLVEYQFEADNAVAQYELENDLPVESLGFRFTRQRLS